MKKNSNYHEIGKLHLFKPDYLSENKKTFLTSNIIKEYLRKRKGRYFYKVNFMKNKFDVKIKENTDIINRKLELKVIENSYKEMKSEIQKRFLDDKNFENEKSVKLKNNYNCLTSRNKSRNNNIFGNMHNTNNSENNNFEKNVKFKKTFSGKILTFFKTNKDLNSRRSYFLKNITNNNKTKYLQPIINKRLKHLKNNLRKKKEFSFDSNQKGNRTEINYFTFFEKDKEMKNSLSNNNIKCKLKTTLNNAKNIEKMENDKYFSPRYNRERILKNKYNFFRIDGENDMNLPTNKFKNFQHFLNFRKKPKPNGKFHQSYVKFFIDNIKRKEKAERSYILKESISTFNISKSNNDFSPKNLHICDYSHNNLKSFNNEIV